jgi:hypothetical protein
MKYLAEYEASCTGTLGEKGEKYVARDLRAYIDDLRKQVAELEAVIKERNDYQHGLMGE